MAEPKATSVIFWGDSLVQATSDPTGLGLRGRLHKGMLHSKFPEVRAFDCGVPGDTTFKLLDRMPCEFTPRLRDVTLSVIWIGLNDAALDERGKNVAATDEFRHELGDCVNAAKQHGPVILIDLHEVNERRTHPTVYGWTYSNERIQVFSKIIQDVAARNEISLVTASRVVFPRYLAPDGLHLNANGYREVSNALRPELRHQLEEIQSWHF